MWGGSDARRDLEDKKLSLEGESQVDAAQVFARGESQVDAAQAFARDKRLVSHYTLFKRTEGDADVGQLNEVFFKTTSGGPRRVAKLVDPKRFLLSKVFWQDDREPVVLKVPGGDININQTQIGRLGRSPGRVHLKLPALVAKVVSKSQLNVQKHLGTMHSAQMNAFGRQMASIFRLLLHLSERKVGVVLDVGLWDVFRDAEVSQMLTFFLCSGGRAERPVDHQKLCAGEEKCEACRASGGPVPFSSGPRFFVRCLLSMEKYAGPRGDAEEGMRHGLQAMVRWGRHGLAVVDKGNLVDDLRRSKVQFDIWIRGLSSRAQGAEEEKTVYKLVEESGSLCELYQNTFAVR